MHCDRSGEQREDNRDHDALLAFRQRKNIRQLHFAYWIGSFTPASRKPFRRSWQESHWPQARPSGAGS